MSKLIPKKQQGGTTDWLKKPEPKRDWLVDWTKRNFPKVVAYGQVMGEVPLGINPIKAVQTAADFTGMPGLVNAVSGNPMNLPSEEVSGAMLPVVGKAAQLTMGLEGAIKPKNSRVLYNMIRNEPERRLTEKEVGFLQKELNERGVLEQQKTSNFPGKEKISRLLENAVKPYDYKIKATINDVKNYIRSPKLREEITKVNIEETTPNRRASWQTYLGRPVKSEEQPFKISNLSTNKSPVYTIDKTKSQARRGNGDGFYDLFPDIEQYKTKSNPVTPGYETRFQDRDTYYNIMGGFGWDTRTLPSGNKEFLATDVWDLHPLKDITNFPNFLRSEKTGLPYKILQKPLSKIQNIDIGTALGIGKPMDIKVGKEWNPVTQRIVRHFKKGGKSINNLKLKTNGKDSKQNSN